MSRARRALSRKWRVLEVRAEKAEALAASRKELLMRVVDWRKIDSLERWDELWADIKKELGDDA